MASIPNKHFILGTNPTMSASASLLWAVECNKCFKRGSFKIRRYPDSKIDIEELLNGEVECTCAGNMILRKHEEKRFKYVYGSVARSLGISLSGQSKGIRIFSDED